MKYYKDYYNDKENLIVRDAIELNNMWFVQVFPFEEEWFLTGLADDLLRYEDKWFINGKQFLLKEDTTSIETFNELMDGQLQAYKDFQEQLQHKIYMIQKAKDILFKKYVNGIEQI